MAISKSSKKVLGNSWNFTTFPSIAFDNRANFSMSFGFKISSGLRKKAAGTLSWSCYPVLLFLMDLKLFLKKLPTISNDFTYHLHNYFNLHVCLSLRRRRRPSRPTFEFPIPSVVWQSVTNKSWLVCVKSEKCTFLVTIRPLGSMR